LYLPSSLSSTQDKIGTGNKIVYESILTGEPKGYEFSTMQKPKTDAEIKCEQLIEELTKSNEENLQLRTRIHELETRLEQYEHNTRKHSLREAKMIDEIVNG
jgi:septal ring factor EnvC (AmiA/AmiB activator)